MFLICLSVLVFWYAGEKKLKDSRCKVRPATWSHWFSVSSVSESSIPADAGHHSSHTWEGLQLPVDGCGFPPEHSQFPQSIILAAIAQVNDNRIK